MARKKVILFIVEGLNDETALALPLERLLTTEAVKIEVTGGDITSDYRTAKGIAARIGECVKKHCTEQKYGKENISEVVLLTDMDGAYLDTTSVFKDASYNDPYYDANRILCKDPKRINISHSFKQQNLNRIISLPFVCTNIPFSVYFFSCNLDHVMCNNANLTDREKLIEAEAFRKRFSNDTEGFVVFSERNRCGIGIASPMRMHAFL